MRDRRHALPMGPWISAKEQERRVSNHSSMVAFSIS